MVITKPTVGASGWNTAVDATIDHANNSEVESVGLDTFTGSTDDAKLTSALSYLGAITSPSRMPALQFPDRDLAFTTTRTPMSGLRIYGASGRGPKNLEVGYPSNDLVPNNITLSCGNGTSSWWYGTGTYQDVYFDNMALTGGSSVQFWHQPSGTLYPAQFHSMNFFGFKHVFGQPTAKALITQVMFTGHWTVVGGSDTQFTVGGSDCDLWTAGYCNLQNSSSVAGAGKPMLIADNLQKSGIGHVYATAVNGWRPFKFTGSLASGSGLIVSGCRCEGASEANGNDGNAVLVTGGGVTLRDLWTAYSMQAPLTGEHGVIEVTGGVVLVDGLTWQRGSGTGATANTVPVVYCSGGVAEVHHMTSSQNDQMPVQAAGGTIYRPSMTTQTAATVNVTPPAVN